MPFSLSLKYFVTFELVGDLQKSFSDRTFANNLLSFSVSNTFFFDYWLILWTSYKGSISIVDWDSCFTWTGVFVPGLTAELVQGLRNRDLFIAFFAVWIGTSSTVFTRIFLTSILVTSP